MWRIEIWHLYSAPCVRETVPASTMNAGPGSEPNHTRTLLLSVAFLREWQSRFRTLVSCQLVGGVLCWRHATQRNARQETSGDWRGHVATGESASCSVTSSTRRCSNNINYKVDMTQTFTILALVMESNWRKRAVRNWHEPFISP